MTATRGGRFVHDAAHGIEGDRGPDIDLINRLRGGTSHALVRVFPQRPDQDGGVGAGLFAQLPQVPNGLAADLRIRIFNASSERPSGFRGIRTSASGQAG